MTPFLMEWMFNGAHITLLFTFKSLYFSTIHAVVHESKSLHYYKKQNHLLPAIFFLSGVKPN